MIRLRTCVEGTLTLAITSDGGWKCDHPMEFGPPHGAGGCTLQHEEILLAGSTHFRHDLATDLAICAPQDLSELRSADAPAAVRLIKPESSYWPIRPP